jgi:outer membrane protein OmpA-like peptidoglycan-associated protein
MGMKKLLFSLMLSAVLLSSCKSGQKNQDTQKTTEAPKSGMTKTEKGVVIGASSGAVVGAMVGNKSKNTTIGAILGATVGGAIGAVIGTKMDKQAKKMETDLGKTAKVERVGEGIKVTFNSQLLFDYGKADVKEANKVNIQELAKSLKLYPETYVLIVGHTDNVGSDAFNQTLSEKRAAAVSNLLAVSGVSNSRIKTEGKGKAQPAVSNDTEENRSQNRRVEIAIYANEKMKADAKEETK